MTASEFVASRCSRRHFLNAGAALGLAVLAAGPCQASGLGLGYQETALLMGTFVRIDVTGCGQAQAQDAVAEAFAAARTLEAELTRFESSSPLGILNSQGTLQDVPEHLALLLEKSRLVHRVTAGSFDPSILPLLSALQESNARGERLAHRELSALLRLVNYDRVQLGGAVRLGHGMTLTLDGIAKGYIAQQMSLSLKKFGCPNHLVNAGGDLVASGQAEGGHPWRVAIRSPHSASQMQGVVSLSNRALATSGVYEQRLRQGSGSHLVVPRTLNRPEIVSASVLAPDGMLADALATAFSVQAPRAVLDLCAGLKGVDCMLVLGNGSMVRSAGWPA